MLFYIMPVVTKSMTWPALVLVLSVMSLTYAINRPVYKIVLTQRGYAQFLQYDVETPPLREFTFCTWIRVYELANDQTIFTYVASGNNRVVRLWLDSGGRFIKVGINGRVTSSPPVDVVKDVWRHICLSFQSDYGAWALYIDSRLVSCEASQSLHGYVLPSGGSVIIGYGTAANGSPNGFEGEIFGANMILASTIERNFTMKRNPVYAQKHFLKNKLKKHTNDLNYVVLSDLLFDDIHNNFEKTFSTGLPNTTNSYVQIRTPFSFEKHNVGIDLSTKLPQQRDTSIEKEIFDFNLPDDQIKAPDIDKLYMWNGVDQDKINGKYQAALKANAPQRASSILPVPKPSEYETPPPVGLSNLLYDSTFSTLVPNKSTEEKISPPDLTAIKLKSLDPLSEVETPPPIDKNTKVYGQWTSSKFAGTVLKYLKSINFQNRDQYVKKVPQTIPHAKISDAYPYASDFKLTKLRPPSQFRRNLVEKRYDMVKRYHPQINVQILEDDLRSNIIKMLQQTQPKKVEITSRGESKNSKEHRHCREVNYDSIDKSESDEEIYKPKPFTLSYDNNKKIRYFTDAEPDKPYKAVLPYVKTAENLVEDDQNTQSRREDNSEDMYSRSLSNANKWHNVKSYSNDYTPRRINIATGEIDNSKQQHPLIRLKYVHDKNKIIKDNDPIILKGRKLALEVSNQSNSNADAVSILKYNHGYLPTQDEKLKTSIQPVFGGKINIKRNMDDSSFDKRVKIGNALNERHVLGDNDLEKKLSFVGGNENIPDINRYRSDIDKENGGVPSSLGPRVCRNVDQVKVLYVQEDESIDQSNIMSPLKEKNIGIAFILQNYKKCSLSESSFQKNAKLFIDWSKTPVRLFGGAYPKTTTDLCGFF